MTRGAAPKTAIQFSRIHAVAMLLESVMWCCLLAAIPAAASGATAGSTLVASAAATKPAVISQKALSKIGTGRSYGANGDDEGIVVFVSFNRSGADPVRQLFKRRWRRHGWRQHSGADGLCHAKPTSVDTSATRLIPKRDYGQPPVCSDVESGAVVQSDAGYCEALNGSRPCRYIFVLRDPVQAMLASYHFDCLGQRASAADRKECPHMSVVDYARSIGNTFTAKMSDRGAWCSRTGLKEGNPLFRSCMAEVTGVDVHEAQLRAMDPGNLALPLDSFLERSSTDPSTTRGIQLMAAFLNDPSALDATEVLRRPSPGEYSPTEDELRQLGKILTHDLALYDGLLSLLT